MATRSSKSPWLPDIVFGFADSADQACALAAALHVPYETAEVHVFPDGECLVRLTHFARHAAIFRSLDHPNQKLIELMLAASVLRDEAASDICLVAPYLPYMRQDRAFRPGEAVSQRVIGHMLAQAFDRFVSVDPHLHRTPDLGTVFGGKPALALSSAGIIAEQLSRKPGALPATTLVLGPDEESAPLAKRVAEPLGLQWATASKAREGDRTVSMTFPADLQVKNRSIVIVDDVVSSGGTIVAIARLLREREAAAITVYATHALFDSAAAAAMRDAGVDEIVSTDTVTHPSNGMSVVGAIAAGLRDGRGVTA
jgi:ribose-phosphate pyrophosphokinase